ncbi:MAG: hypothetical protein Q8P10_01435 [bacterium]|nr:hypothetical protein [bacterium]
MQIAEKTRQGLEERFKPRHREYKKDEVIGFVLQSIDSTSDPFNPRIDYKYESMKIDQVAGGGFFGKVLIPQERNYVIKTSRPDSWHEFWRSINWGLKPFPAQISEEAAQLEHIGTKLIHKVLLQLSGGNFTSPDSIGYTKLENGYAQVVERVYGRGPRFDLGNEEYEEFKTAQEELTDLALRLGLEQGGQIYRRFSGKRKTNPFGMANLWKDPEKGTFIWMDTIPAIPHNGFIYPFFHYGFHKELRHWFNQKARTFNRIHTGYFMQEVARNKHLFSEEEYQKIKNLAVLYENIWEKHRQGQAVQKRDVGSVAKALGRASLDFIPRTVVKPIKKGIIEPAGITFSAKFRKKEILKGVDKARKLGLITEKEWEEGLETIDNPKIPNKDKVVIGALLTYYASLYPIMKAVEALGYVKAVSDQNPVLGVASFVGGIVVPPLLRYLGTRGIGVLSRTDLRVAATFSAIPTAGNIAPVPAHIAYITGAKSKIAWHYFLREIIADLSKLKPQGGWCTDFEAKLWQKIGVHLEKLAESQNTGKEEVKPIQIYPLS